MSAVAAQPNMDELGNLIRHWAHYDTMLATLNKQIKNVRDMKTSYEAQVLERLRLYNAENAVIQIAGGRLSVAEDKYTQPLSFKNLEGMLHGYYRQKPGKPDETKEILAYIRSQRQTHVSKCLKRTTQGPAPPGPPV
jgi:pyruvate/oxaloacetate carboxyltransferase